VFQTKAVEKIKTHILFSITFFENLAVYKIMWKLLYSRTGYTWQNGECTVRAGYL